MGIDEHVCVCIYNFIIFTSVDNMPCAYTHGIYLYISVQVINFPKVCGWPDRHQFKNHQTSAVQLQVFVKIFVVILFCST